MNALLTEFAKKTCGGVIAVLNIIALSLGFSRCTSDEPTNRPDISVAGFEGSDAKYWKNVNRRVPNMNDTPYAKTTRYNDYIVEGLHG